MGRKGRRPLRVLAVDDSTVMRGVLRILFDLHEKQGDPALPPMELCGLVRDGVEGLEAVRDLEPDVLLLDIDMPRMDGLKVLEQLRYVAPQLPVIVCSGSTEPGARATFDALARGAKDFVMKSGQQRDLTAALGSLMQQLMPKIAALSAGQESSDDAPEPVTNHDCARPSAEPFAGRIDGEAAVEIVVIARLPRSRDDRAAYA
jgi:two-component system chemotaxis response regulator CheB